MTSETVTKALSRKKYSFVPVVDGIFVGIGWVSAGGVVGVG